MVEFLRYIIYWVIAWRDIYITGRNKCMVDSLVKDVVIKFASVN